MYHWFKPSDAGSCSLNVSLITVTLLLVVGFSALSLHPVVKKVTQAGEEQGVHRAQCAAGGPVTRGSCCRGAGHWERNGAVGMQFMQCGRQR